MQVSYPVLHFQVSLQENKLFSSFLLNFSVCLVSHVYDFKKLTGIVSTL